MFKSWGFPIGSVVKNPPAKKEMLFDPRVQKIPWSRKWQPTPVFLPGKSHGQRSLAGCRPLHHGESDMTEQLSMFKSQTLLAMNILQIFPLKYIKYISSLSTNVLIIFFASPKHTKTGCWWQLGVQISSLTIWKHSRVTVYQKSKRTLHSLFIFHPETSYFSITHNGICMKICLLTPFPKGTFALALGVNTIFIALEIVLIGQIVTILATPK